MGGRRLAKEQEIPSAKEEEKDNAVLDLTAAIHRNTCRCALMSTWLLCVHIFVSDAGPAGCHVNPTA